MNERTGRHACGVSITTRYSARDEGSRAAHCIHRCSRHLRLIVFLFDNDRQLWVALERERNLRNIDVYAVPNRLAERKV